MEEEIDIQPALGITAWQLVSIGVLSAIPFWFPVALTIYWLAIFIFCLVALVKDKPMWIWYAVAASPGMEVWGRMRRGPYLPDETGKYFLAFAILLLLLQHVFRRSEKPLHRVATIITLLLLPSLIAGLSTFDMQDWIFNILGPLELCALLFFAARERWHIELFCRALQMALLPIVAIAMYVTVKNPSFDDLQFGLLSSSASAGGFGANQISTILGTGVLLTMLLLLLKRPLFALKWANYLLLFYLLFRALITFSRGGIIVAIISIIIALYPYIFASLRSFLKYTALFAFILVAGTLVFIKVNDMTGNMLLLRYEGETPGTLAGTREKSLNLFLSGRADIVESDIKIFADHPIFGAGPGGARQLRSEYGYIPSAAHTEYSRLLSEHGIGGVAVIIVLSVFPFVWIRRQNLKQWKGIIGALFTLAILTTFHAAMRTNVLPVFYALAAIPVLYYSDSEEDEDTLPG
ncbi:MAG: hypothetical protein EOP51_01865 [Sphingobacteriales bacterium]|nr:MAG: hypothetical protein EOP51_01865 [Sphingobacteriales bacterium]